MQKKIVYFSLFSLVAILQLTFLPLLARENITADLVLMTILAWAVADGFAAFLNWAIVLGLIYDLITFSPLGEHALIFLCVVYFVSFFSRRFTMEFRGIGLILFLGFVVFATLVSHVIIALVLAFKLNTIHSFWRSFGGFWSLSKQLFWNVIFFLSAFVFIKRTKKFFAITTN